MEDDKPVEAKLEVKEEVKPYKAIADQILQIKEKGNLQFKKKAYKEAIKLFSEGIKHYEEAGKPKDHENIGTTVTQIYTNRCLAFHSIDQQNSVLSDATYVLENLDKLNAKALFRRVHAYKQMEKYAEAVKDYEVLVNQTSDGKQFSKDLYDCKKLLEKQLEKQAESFKANKI